MIDWTTLSERIGLEDLPAFHRAFLAAKGVDTEGMMLRRVQQAVEREINKLVQAGRAERHDDRVHIHPDEVPDVVLPGGVSVRALVEQLLRETA